MEGEPQLSSPMKDKSQPCLETDDVSQPLPEVEDVPQPLAEVEDVSQQLFEMEDESQPFLELEDEPYPLSEGNDELSSEQTGSEDSDEVEESSLQRLNRRRSIEYWDRKGIPCNYKNDIYCRAEPLEIMKHRRNQVAIVTGCCGTIGEHVARRLAREGMRVIAMGIKNDHLKKQFEVLYPNCTVYEVDLTAPEQVSNAFKWVQEKYDQKLDVVVLCNSLREAVPEQDVPPLRTWQDIVNLNLSAIAMWNKIAVKAMQSTEPGIIINVSPTKETHFPIRFDRSAHRTAMFGLGAFIRALQAQLDKEGSRIKVVTIDPGEVYGPSLRHAVFRRRFKRPPEFEKETRFSELPIRSYSTTDAATVSSTVVYVLCQPEDIHITEITLRDKIYYYF